MWSSGEAVGLLRLGQGVGRGVGCCAEPTSACGLKGVQKDLPPALANTSSDKAQQMVKQVVENPLYHVLEHHAGVFWGKISVY